jgi:5,10-methenyltetrahydrofolate synthetase
VKNWSDVASLRRQWRSELVQKRQQIDAVTRHDASERINASLEAAFDAPVGNVVAFCWPYKSEVDVRFAIRTLRDRGLQAALPGVSAKASALTFHAWSPGATMAPGALGIPVPQGTAIVTPQLAFAPLVGFDEEGYRLGYGGGYFDRTLASLRAKPITAGVGFEALRLPTIHPQAHDVPMDFIVTEAGIYAVRDGSLDPLDAASARNRVTVLAATRALW